jgi:DNA-binding response OmpR family regulator
MNNRKIVLVEDEAAARHFLRLEGFDVAGFSTGAEAVSHLERSEPHARSSSIRKCR